MGAASSICGDDQPSDSETSSFSIEPLSLPRVQRWWLCRRSRTRLAQIQPHITARLSAQQNEHSKLISQQTNRPPSQSHLISTKQASISRPGFVSIHSDRGSMIDHGRHKQDLRSSAIINAALASMNQRDREHSSCHRSANNSRKNSLPASINNSPQFEPINSILHSINHSHVRADSIPLITNHSPRLDAEPNSNIHQSHDQGDDMSEEEESLTRQAELRDRSKSFLAPLQVRNSHPFAVNDSDQAFSAPVTNKYSPHGGSIFGGVHFNPNNSDSPRSTTITSHADMTRSSVGSNTLNQYELCSGALGSGRFGTVIKVRDMRDNTIYAMKIISKHGVARSRGLSKSRTAASTPQNLASTWSETSMQCNTPYNNPTEQAWQAIRREVAIMMSLDHPNVVRLIEVIDDARADALYLVMELAAGGPIVHDLQNTRAGHQMIAGALPLPTIRTYFRQVFTGLAYLDSVGVVHRDIKPSNLLLSHAAGDPLCTVKIADFGMSHSVMNERVPQGTTPLLNSRQIAPDHRQHAFSFSANNAAIASTTHSIFSQHEALMSPSALEHPDRPTNAGSAAFLSPEQCGFNDPACRASHCSHDAVSSDIWAAGISLFLCAFECLPFYSASPHELYRAIVQDEAEFPEWKSDMLALGTDEEWTDLESLIVGLLCKRPCQRLTFDDIACHPFLTQRGQLDELDYELETTNRIERTFTVLNPGHNKQQRSISSMGL